jgi:glyoxylase-like metal-dependent hydrolase (beta-lactamase superfamily II)
MISPRVFTGGDLATNGYLLEGRDGTICFDAPEGTARELMRTSTRPVALVLTHGHFDHIWDSYLVQHDHHCPVFVHSADAPMVIDTSYVKMFGVTQTITSPTALEYFKVPEQGAAPFLCAGEEFQMFHIPGHSPGSVVFYHPGCSSAAIRFFAAASDAGTCREDPAPPCSRACKNISSRCRRKRASTPDTVPTPPSATNWKPIRTSTYSRAC